jgi:elongation factor P
MATTSDLQKGTVIKWRDDLYTVADFQHVNPGKGAAFIRTKLKNLRTGKVFEETFKSGETVEIVEVEKKKMNYLYGDASGFYFMDNQTYEQVTLPRAVLEGREGLIKEGAEAMVMLHDDIPINAELPKKITLRVTEAAPAVRGDTSGNLTKEVTVETGYKLQVPGFIKAGDEIIINTDTGEYVERA